MVGLQAPPALPRTSYAHPIRIGAADCYDQSLCDRLRHNAGEVRVDSAVLINASHRLDGHHLMESVLMGGLHVHTLP